MTFDSAGAWYLVDFSSNSNVLAVKYFDSIIAPNSETIADYKRCNQPPCELGNIGNLADSSIVQDLNGGFHVVYSVEIPGGGKIIYMHLERKNFYMQTACF